MVRKTLCWFTLVSFIAHVHGCYSKSLVSRDEFERHPTYQIAAVVTTEGEVIEFVTKPGGRGAALRDSVVVGPSRAGAIERVPLSRVQRVSVSKRRAGRRFAPTVDVPIEELKQYPKDCITAVRTVDGAVIRFETDARGRGASLEDSVIVGRPRGADIRSIPISQIQALHVLKHDAGKTFLSVIGVTVIVGVIIVGLVALLKESCPFVYSFDGERYVFDGEPYGGAICPARQRTDWCRLDNLRPVEGGYRLLLTNEVNETQYTDEFKLLVVDHPADTQVVPDAEGTLYSIEDPQEPLWAVEADDTDITKWLCRNDLLLWESDVLSKNPDDAADLRDTLLLAFPRPASAQRAKLVVNGCTTLWGSQMLKRMTELHGAEVDAWWESQNDPAVRDRVDAWIRREEAYVLLVKVWTGTGWTTRGELLGGGPFVAEDRVVPVDLHGVGGDTLRVLLTPAAGFWQLNSFAVDYSSDVDFEVQEVAASSVTGHDGNDLRAILGETDGDYYVMPEIGQRADLRFPVPEPRPGLARTVFAQVSGYYDLHLDKTGLPDRETLARLAYEPGYVTKFALKEYLAWRENELAKAGRLDH